MLFTFQFNGNQLHLYQTKNEKQMSNIKNLPFIVECAIKLMNTTVRMHHDLENVYVLDLPCIQFYYVDNLKGPGIHRFQIATEEGKSLYEGDDLSVAVYSAKKYMNEYLKDDVLIQGYGYAAIFIIDVYELTQLNAFDILKQMKTLCGLDIELRLFSGNEMVVDFGEATKEEFQFAVEQLSDNNVIYRI